MNIEDVRKIHNAYIYGQEAELDRLWREECPKTLIKFFPAKYDENGVNYLLKHIQEKTIWMASPSTFNDPFDCVANVDSRKEAFRIQQEFMKNNVDETITESVRNSVYGELLLNLATEEFEKDVPRLRAEIEEKIYATCFSEPDNIYSIRMWGHYANNHRGVCVEYDFNTVKDMFQTGCIPIKYTDVFSQKIYRRGIVAETQMILNLIYEKAAEWEYEKEWRGACYLDKNRGDGFCLPCGRPKRVYLGCRIGEKLKKDVVELCRENGVEVLRMKLLPESYKLYFDKNL